MICTRMQWRHLGAGSVVAVWFLAIASMRNGSRARAGGGFKSSGSAALLAMVQVTLVIHVQLSLGERNRLMAVDTDDTTQLNRDQRRKRSFKEYYGTFSASPLILLVLGVAALVAAIFGLFMEIGTSEALVYHTAQNSSIWQIMMQPYYLFVGAQSFAEKLSWLYGWGVEIVDLVFAFAFNHATAALHKTNSKIAKFFGPASVILVGLNTWSNVNCLPGLDPMIQGLVGLLVAVCVVVFPVVGLALIERAIAELGD